jgi:hypothetical protein
MAQKVLSQFPVFSLIQGCPFSSWIQSLRIPGMTWVFLFGEKLVIKAVPFESNPRLQGVL